MRSDYGVLMRSGYIQESLKVEQTGHSNRQDLSVKKREERR